MPEPRGRTALVRLQERARELVNTFPRECARAGINRGFVRNLTILSGGSVLAQVFSIGLAPVLTRLYLPANFGQLALFAAFLNVAIVTVSLRYELAIVSASSDREAAQLTFCALLLALPISCVAALAFYLFVRNGILGYDKMPVYAAALIVPALVCVAAFSAFRYWLVRNERFGLISEGVVAQNASRALSQTALGLLGPYTAALLAGEIIGRGAGVGRMIRTAWPGLLRELRNSSLSHLYGTMLKNRRFVLYSLPSSLLDTLAVSIPFPLMVYIYGLNAGGNYSLVSRVLALPAVLITANVADAFHSRAALLSQQKPEALPGLVKRMAAVLLLTGLFPAAILVVFGPLLFGRIFGEKWIEAGVMGAWVAPWFLAGFVVNPLTRMVLVIGRQEVKFTYDIIVFLGTIGVFVLAHHQRWPVMTAIAVLGVLNTAAYAVFYVLLLNISSTHVQQARPAIEDLP